ncbi:MAG: site-2 protease family protein [Promethearchaeia archaeon]
MKKEQMNIGKIRGINIKFHWSTVLIVALVGFYAGSYYTNLIGEFNPIWAFMVGITSGLIMLFSILAHELMHSIVSQKYGLDVGEIEFYMFGGASKIMEEPETPKLESYIAAVGPAMSFILGISFLGTLFFSQIFFSMEYPESLFVILFYAGVSNIGLGLFNLLPAYPMDGGRILRAILWKKKDSLLGATKTASNVGKYLGYGLVGLGFIEMLLIGFTGGFWLVIIGSFISSSAKRAYLRTVYEVKLSKLKASKIATSMDVSIPKHINVGEAISDYFIHYKRSYFPVKGEGRFTGLVDINSVKNIPMEARSQKKIGEVMMDLSDFPTIKETETGKKAFMKLGELEDKPPIVVVRSEKNEEIIGFITLKEIESALKMSDLLFESF